MKLGLLLLQLFEFDVQFARQHLVVLGGVLPDLVGEFFEFVFELFFLHHYFFVGVAQLVKLLFHFLNLFTDGNEFAFVVFSAHFVFFELPE